jgi:hypothetical protein
MVRFYPLKASGLKSCSSLIVVPCHDRRDRWCLHSQLATASSCPNACKLTNVDVWLSALEDGVCAVDVQGASGGLLLHGILKGVGAAVPEALACGPQERSDRPECGRHCEDLC